MKIKKDFTNLWNKAVAEGLMKNVFKNGADKIEAGLKLKKNKPTPYIKNLVTNKDICETHPSKIFPNGMEIIFNPFEALKPGATILNSGKQKDLPNVSEECVFACQDINNPLSILKRKPLFTAELSKSEWLAFPNVTPWEPRGLLLWVPKKLNKITDAFPHEPQSLSFSLIEDFLEISKLDKNFTTFYNSHHGGASANHIHFQSSYFDHKFAVESAKTTQKGKYAITTNYPATALFFTTNVSAETLWEPIEKIQKVGYPLNLIALTSGICLFIRDPNNEIVDEFPGRGLGAINFAGLMITSDKTDFIRVTEKIIASAFKKAIIDSGKLDQLLK